MLLYMAIYVNILSSALKTMCCCVFGVCVWVLTLPGWLWLPMAEGRPSGGAGPLLVGIKAGRHLAPAELQKTQSS